MVVTLIDPSSDPVFSLSGTPTITAVRDGGSTPATVLGPIHPGQQLTLLVQGTEFAAGAGITPSNGDATGTVSGNTGTALTVDYRASATLGSRSLSVINPSGASGSTTLSVTTSAPTVTALNPTSAPRLVATTFTVTGTDIFATPSLSTQTVKPTLAITASKQRDHVHPDRHQHHRGQLHQPDLPQHAAVLDLSVQRHGHADPDEPGRRGGQLLVHGAGHMRRRRAGAAGAKDAGMTLAEVLVGMMVLSLFLVVLSSAIVSLTRSARRNTDTVNAQLGTRQAYFLLDKQLRYADAITTPATISGDQWIEWRVPVQSQSRCYQWRASPTSGLQFRTWIVPASGGVAVPVWTTVAGNLNIGSQPVFSTSTAALAAAPFSIPAAAATYGLPQARVGVAVTVAIGSPAATSSMSTVFTALNADAVGSSVCGEVPRS